MRHIKRAERGPASYVLSARSNKVDEVVRTGLYFFFFFFFFFFSSFLLSLVLLRRGPRNSRSVRHAPT
jgi:hypothetical protein